VIDALGLDRPLLVGHSLGGAIALAVALDYPEKICGLALISPMTHPIEGDVPAAFRAMLVPSPLARRIVGWTLAAPLGRLNRKAGLELVFGPETPPDDFDSAGGGALSLRPGNFFAASSEVSLGSGALTGQAARYSSLGVPTAVLFGRGDRILDPALQGRRLADAAPGATLELIDGGHMIPLTRPDETAAWMRRFIGTIG
jgi:pimeloyl-ACP methyl ester carboxylesterase